MTEPDSTETPAAEVPWWPISTYAGPVEPASGPPPIGFAWMITFTDLIALMLTFFVLLFSMSKVEQRQWQNLTDALADNLNLISDRYLAQPKLTLDIESVQTLPSADLDYLGQLLSQDLSADPLLRESILRRLDDRIVLVLPGELLFAPDSTALAASGRRSLIALAGLLRHVNNGIEVLGHADPRKPGAGYVSNWELSLTRALSVARMLNVAGYSGQVVARGFGHSRFGALSPRLSEAQRLALGRRVELVIHDHAWELD